MDRNGPRTRTNNKRQSETSELMHNLQIKGIYLHGAHREGTGWVCLPQDPYSPTENPLPKKTTPW